MSRVDDAYRRLRKAPEQPPGDDGSPASANVFEGYPVEGGGASEQRAILLEPSRAAVQSLEPGGSHKERTRRARTDRGPFPAPSRRAFDVQPQDRRLSDAQGGVDDQVAGSTDIDRASPSTFIWGTMRVLVRRKWLVLAAFAVCFAGSVLFLRTLKPLFRATTRLTVETRTTTDALLKTPPESAPQQGYLETMAEVLRSRSIAETAASTLVLWQHPEYAPFAGGSSPAPDAPAPEGVVGRLMAKTVVTTIPGSTVLNVTVESGDPELASNAANVISQTFIERDLESRLGGAKEASDWIGRQLEEQRTRVTETEAALQRYREAQNAASLDERQNIVVQRLGDLNAAVTRARTDRIAKEEMYKRVTALQDQQALLDTVPAVAANSYIQQMKGQLDQLDRQLKEASVTLGDRHPEIIRLTTAKADAAQRLAAEIGTVAATLHNEFLTAQAGEQSLSASLEAQKREAQDLDRKGVEYAALVREADSNRALYQNLLEQAKSIGLSSDLQRSNVRILDKATTPRAPVNPVGRLGMLLAAIASMTFAAGLGFVVEYLDPRIRTLDEVSDQLGLPLLGYVEQLRVGADSVPVLTSEDLPPRFQEAVGRIRAGIEGQAGPQGGVLLTTSSGPKEGKTFVASNLALAFALAGRRVLLIDCDLRRSRVHEAFSLSLEPGLTTYLKSPESVTWDSVVQPGPCPGLSIMTAGPAPTNPAEMVGRGAFAELLAEARETYDWVVVDSPPVMAVADAHMLARLADHVLFVAAADQTRRNAAKLAVSQLRRARARLVGVVLNRVALPRWGAFYSPYYNSDYDSYYTKGEQS